MKIHFVQNRKENCERNWKHSFLSVVSNSSLGIEIVAEFTYYITSRRRWGKRWGREREEMRDGEGYQNERDHCKNFSCDLEGSIWELFWPNLTNSSVIKADAWSVDPIPPIRVTHNTFPVLWKSDVSGQLITNDWILNSLEIWYKRKYWLVKNVFENNSIGIPITKSCIGGIWLIHRIYLL